MEIQDDEIFPTAIDALGPLFKLFEVHLWDDDSKEIFRVSSFPKHTRFKHKDDDDCCNGGTKSNLNGEVLDDNVLLEVDMDLAQQMSSLGLPVSFQTNKDKNYGKKKGKRRGNSIMKSGSQESGQDELLQLPKFRERENSFGKEISSPEIINPTDTTLNGNIWDESSTKLPSSNGTTVEDFSSCMTSDHKQPSGVAESSDGCVYNAESSCQYTGSVAESSDGFVCNAEGSCHYTGSLGSWRAIWDSYHMRNYFYNVETDETTWYPPPGMEHLVLSNNLEESVADIVRDNPVPAVSSNESNLACKSSEGECGTDGKMLDQLASNNTVKDYESQLCAVDRCSPIHSYSSVDILEPSLALNDNMNGICDCEIPCSVYADGTAAHLSTSGSLTETVNEVDEEGMLTVAADKIDFEVVPAYCKRKKKASKPQSKKTSPTSDQEQLFQWSIDAYSIANDKYWCQRYLLFSRFDQGIKMDREGWYSVTPESIARHQASQCGSGVVIDCFTGVGGNAIQFAKTAGHVIAIDIDPNKIEYAKANAVVYGVEDQIDFVIGDSFSLASTMKADTVFMSPPWGGPEYSKVKTYDLAMLKPYDGKFIFDTFKETASTIVMFLPRNVDMNQLAELCLSAGPLWSVEVEMNFLNNKLKAVTAYFRKASS